MTTCPPKTRVPRIENGVLELPAITLWQPWATLLVRGLKAFETRSWPHSWRDAPTVVAIHAAKRSPPTGVVNSIIEAVDDVGLIRELMGPHPLGAVVGLVVFDRPRLMQVIGDGDVRCPGDSNEFALGDWSPGRYGWLALASCAFGTPVPAAGRQGAWTWKVPASLVEPAARAAERTADTADLRTSDREWRWLESTWPSMPPWDIDRSEFDPWRKS
jgi:hypothetical protein